MYTTQQLNKAGLCYFNLSSLNKHLEIMKRTLVCVFVCVQSLCEEMRMLERFYKALILCLNPMKSRPHLNPACILYKYLSMCSPPFKTLRFILDKPLTPKPPLKEPICPPMNLLTAPKLHETLDNDPNFGSAPTNCISCQTHSTEPQTTSFFV